jgi:hypothetical protein
LSTQQIEHGLQAGLKILKSTISVIESKVLKGGEEVDKRTMGVASRLVELLEKVASMIDILMKKVPSQQSGILELSPNFYIFQGPDSTIILRTRPEHVAVIISPRDDAVSIKTRRGVLTVSPKSIVLASRGRTFEVAPIEPEVLDKMRDELRTLLKLYEKVVYRRLHPYVERFIAKKA